MKAFSRSAALLCVLAAASLSACSSSTSGAGASRGLSELTPSASSTASASGTAAPSSDATASATPATGAGAPGAEAPGAEAPSPKAPSPAAPTAPTAPTAPKPPSAGNQQALVNGIPPCDPANLSLRMLNGEGAAGSVYYAISLINQGTQTCYLEGYPSIRTLDAADEPAGGTAQHTTAVPEHVVLKRSQRAYLNLRVINTGMIDKCIPGDSEWLEIVFPHSSHVVKIPAHLTVCANGIVNTEVGPFSASKN